MNKNLFLAVSLSIVVYVAWFMWAEKGQKDKALSGGSPSVAAAVQKTPTPASFAETSSQKPGAPALAQGQASHYRTDKLDIAIAPAGAGIENAHFYGPVGSAEMVLVKNPGFFATMPGLNFTEKTHSASATTFEAAAPGGIVITKTYQFSHEGSLGKIEIRARNTGKAPAELPAWALTLGPGLGTVKSEIEENPSNWKAAYTIQQEGKKRPTLEDLSKDKPAKEWIWAGVQNRYFLAAFIPENWEGRDLSYIKGEIGGKEAPGLAVGVPASAIAAGQEKVWTASFYIGPKDYRLLQKLGHGLDRSVEFGFFSPLGKLAMDVLYFNYKITHNYGWSIIVLTIIIQLLLSPLTYKSTKATLIMKKLQPELTRIQAKFKDDPARLNKEMIELYRNSGANPLSGCLPMLLQMPVFFALFTALRNSWDLHGSSWVLWLTDLSSKDPYYVLPIIMGGIMFVQQRFTAPTGGDPAQAAVLKWMPVLFTFMFLSFPSGLVLYWLTSSLVGFAQQMYLQKKFEGQ